VDLILFICNFIDRAVKKSMLMNPVYHGEECRTSVHQKMGCSLKLMFWLRVWNQERK
jgi:hypothetical protein